MRYLLDTSAICDAWRFYPHSVFPNLWDKFVELIEGNNCNSVDDVNRELENWSEYNKEDIREHPIYIIKRRNDFFIEPSDEVRMFFQKRVEFYYKSSGKTINDKPFADPLLIAEAGLNGYCLITSERLKGLKSIPGICAKLGIKCGGLDSLMKRERWIF